MSAGQKAALLDEIRTKAMHGWDTLRAEPAWGELQNAIDTVNGKPRYERTRALSTSYTNRCRRIVNTHSALLTDVRPVWNYDTYNEEMKRHGEVFNKLSRRWWRARRVDRTLKGSLYFSDVGGSGYVYITWDKDIKDLRCDVLDPRMVVPIDPIYDNGSIQEWRGVIVRQRLPKDVCRQKWPSAMHLFNETSGSWFASEPERTRPGFIRRFSSYFWEGSAGSSRGGSIGQEIMRIYLRDDSKNTESEPVEVGEPGTNWSYVVEPGEKLWPRGKLVLATPEEIFEVLPNPYWHGMFPLVRFTLFPCAGTLLGLSCVQDVLALQHSLNECIRGLDDARDKILMPAVIADLKAMPDNVLKKIDPRQPGAHHSVNTLLTGSDGFRFSEPPNIPNYYIQYMQWLEQEIDDLAGIKGIEQLAQLKQLPAENTVEEFRQALSPILKDMARSLSVSVAEMAEMMKYNFLQWYDQQMRVDILGEEGLTLSDADQDPTNMVPAGMEGASLEERAKKLASSFHFTVTENSFLNMNNASKKMMDFQMWRGGGLSLHTMMTSMDVQNPGKRLGESEMDEIIAERRVGLLPGSPPELVQAQTAAQLMQAQMMAAQMSMQMQAPQMGGGQPQPGQAQQPNPAQPSGGAGRPPSGNEPPHIEAKDGGTRMAVSES